MIGSFLIHHPYLMIASVLGIIAATIARWLWHKKPVYQFSSLLPFSSMTTTQTWKDMMVSACRLTALTFLACAIAQIRQPDQRSEIPVQGIDIMLVLDLSGSMEAFDDLQDRKTRFQVAIQEAQTFIQERLNDQIGLVIFGAAAICRVPLTMDKKLLDDVLSDLYIGIIDPDGTALARALLTGVKRLALSQAQSRVIIALTDGIPQGDIPARIPVSLAKKLGIKIYTIGIGSPEGCYIRDQFGAIHHAPHTLNTALLESIAEATGGRSYSAKNSGELKQVYESIDALEKSEQIEPLYSRYTEYFTLFLWLALAMIMLELLITAFFWMSLAW